MTCNLIKNNPPSHFVLQNPFEEIYAVAAAIPAGYYQCVKTALGQRLSLYVPASAPIAAPATEWSS